jgi:TonB family protein
MTSVLAAWFLIVAQVPAMQAPPRAAPAGATTKAAFLELAATMTGQGRFDEAVNALRGAAALEPTLAEPQHRIAMFLWDKLSGVYVLDQVKTASYIQQAIDAEDRVLLLQPRHADAVAHKSALMRLKANASTDPIQRQNLLEEADVLRNRIAELQRPAEMPPRAAGVEFAEPFDQAMARLQPLRVGGSLRTPIKVKDVPPVYPAIAMSARVQGVVILEALVDSEGNVANARILKSLPLLDAAALQSVSQWKFAPTEVNGRPVALIMTITVSFALQ